MARPRTKTELITASEDKMQLLMALIDSMPAELLEKPFNFNVEKEKGAHWERDKNVRDVLVHLYEWHVLLIHWITENQNGNPKQFLPDGYNWKTYGAMNQAFWHKHQQTSLDHAKQLLVKSHEQVMMLLDSFTNEALFTKGVFPWVGGSVLGSYFVSSTASHYEWAIKKIKKHKNSVSN